MHANLSSTSRQERHVIFTSTCSYHILCSDDQLQLPWEALVCAWWGPTDLLLWSVACNGPPWKLFLRLLDLQRLETLPSPTDDILWSEMIEQKLMNNKL